MQARDHPVGAALRGAWRAEPDLPTVSESSLTASLPVLTSTGAAGLAWNRVKRDPGLSVTEPALELRRHAQALALEAACHEAALGDLVDLFDSAGISPLLFKGRVLAQHYGQPHLRAMGDVDLCAPPGRFDALADLLRGHGFRELNSAASTEHGRALLLMAPVEWPGKRLLVDLHERLEEFFMAPLEDVFARARPMPFAAHSVLVPAPEDHLRIVAIHFLRDGGWRPSALCDVGALLESIPPAFDWDLCLGTDTRRRRWIGCTFELAHGLLGARLDALPAECRVPNPPRWLSSTVLRAWDKPISHHWARIPFRLVLRKSRFRIPAEALARWPDGIRASVELGAAFTRLPRWPYQLLFFSRAIGRFVWLGFGSGTR